MTYLATDPSEYPGTPEYDEILEERHRLRVLMLELLAEQEELDKLQYPYRFSHS